MILFKGTIMIPAIVVALCIGVAVHNAKAEPDHAPSDPVKVTPTAPPVQVVEVDTPDIVQEVLTRVATEPDRAERSNERRETRVRRSNIDRRPTADDYQALVDRQHVSLRMAWSKEYELASLFMDKYLKQPHIVHTPTFTPAQDVDEYVNAYQQRFTTDEGRRLWQVCAIYTDYGYIYFSLMLEDDGTVPKGSRGVLISYQDANLEYDIAGMQAIQTERFGEMVYFANTDQVKNENVLSLFLGDADHPHSVNHYLKGLSV
jgi:hypothetical protein